MRAFRKFQFAAVAGLLSAAPVSAAPDGTLGMAIMAAGVEANGTLNRGSGAVSSIRDGAAGTGRYLVHFDRDILDCHYYGTIGEPTQGGFAFSGFITVNIDEFTSNGLFIQTANFNGALADKAFHVMVFCQK